MSRPFLPDRPAAVATLVATHGSSPRTPGARMWVDGEGGIVGGVTIGGCVDARVIAEAREVLAEGVPRLLTMALGDDDAAALGLTCAGTIEVLMEPFDPGSASDIVGRSLALAGAEVAAGRTVGIVVPLDGSRGRLMVRSNGQRGGTLGDPGLDAAVASEALPVVATGESSVISLVHPASGEPWRAFVDVHAPPLTLVIFGATHVAQPLADLAHTLGLRVVVVDGREQFATAARFPTADERLVGMPSEIADRLPLGERSMVVLLSHDYKYDLPVLRRVLQGDAAYVGCLGSVRRGRALLEFLAGEGIAPEALARVRMPIGLDIGARTPAEIALSVLAEGMAVLRGRAGGPLRDRARAS